MSEKLNEVFILEQKAQKMELINEEVALKLYLEIFENHTPKLSRTYEGAIRLLEKRGQYEKALEICEKAVKGISLNELSGVLSKFNSLRDRLNEKIAQQVPQTQEPVKKHKKFNVKRFVVLLLLLLVAIAFYLTQKPERDLYVNLDGKQSLEGGDSFTKTTEDKEKPYKNYPVTENMIEVANNSLQTLHDVKAGDIIPQEDTLGIAIIVTAGTTEERAKEIADIYLKSLGGAGAATYNDLTGPTEDTYGSLYDYYEIIVVVGYSKEPVDTLAKGTKTKGAKKLFWRKIES